MEVKNVLKKVVSKVNKKAVTAKPTKSEIESHECACGGNCGCGCC